MTDTIESFLGHAIHVARHGPATGAPLLALHPTLAHGGLWSGLARRLDRPVIAPDLPGHGRSGAWDGETDLHDIATAAALACLDAPMPVIGHSFGGTVALRLALEAPERVSALVLIEPVLFAAARETRPADFAALEARMAPVMRALEAGEREDAARRFTRLWGDGTPWDALPAAARTMLAAQMPFVAGTEATLMRDAQDLLRPGRLEKLEMPVLLLRGTEGDPVVPAIHQALLNRIGTAREEVIAGAGHMSPKTHGAEVAEKIAAFLAATG